MMMDYDYLKECFDYQDGHLVWRARPLHHYKNAEAMRACNAKLAGKPIKTKDQNGYVVVGLNKKRYYVHRLIWWLLNGELPSDQIDHKNGDRSDNSIKNLRCVDGFENHLNLKKNSRNKSGYTGVSFCNTSGKWRASVRYRHKEVLAKWFDTVEEAAELAEFVRQELGFSKRHGNDECPTSAKSIEQSSAGSMSI